MTQKFVSESCMLLRFFSSKRLRCGTAEVARPERSELEMLTAVATTDLFDIWPVEEASPCCDASVNSARQR